MKTSKQKALVASALRTEFLSFCRRAFETVNGGSQLSKDPYIDVVCAFLQKVASGKVMRFVLNLPPRHAKTFLASVCLAAWELAHHPDRQIMVVCYGEDLAQDIAYQCGKSSARTGSRKRLVAGLPKIAAV